MVAFTTPPVTLTNGTTADATRVMQDLNQIVSDGNANVIAKDGSVAFTASQSMGGFRLTSLGLASATSDAVTAGQVQSSSLTLLSSVSGTDTITATAAPSLAGYSAGQTLQFISAGANTTTTVTLNVNSLGAKNILRAGGGALAVGDIANGQVVEVYYNGTYFEFTNTQHASNADLAVTQTLGDSSTKIATTAFVSASISSFEKVSLQAAQATTSGTSIVFGSIPSWAKKVTFILNSVSTSGIDLVVVRLGTVSGFDATGYAGASSYTSPSGGTGAINTGGGATINGQDAAAKRSGLITFINVSGNIWCFSGCACDENGPTTYAYAGTKTLSGLLTQLSLTTINGTDTFDHGSANVLIEG